MRSGVRHDSAARCRRRAFLALYRIGRRAGGAHEDSARQFADHKVRIARQLEPVQTSAFVAENAKVAD